MPKRLRSRPAAVVCAAIVLQACSGQQWSTHKDPSGFSVSLPPGWKAAADGESGRVAVTGPAQQRVVVWPVFLPGGVNAASAGMLLQRLAAPAGFAGWRWTAPRTVAPQAVRMDGSAGPQTAVASLAWTGSPRGAAGYVFVTAAPRAVYQPATFSRILGSFRVTGNAAGRKAPADSIRYVEFRDPLENAFTVEVPAGWSAEGGMYRFASVDTRAALNLASPDRQVRISFGDKELGSFVEPNQMLEWTGFREGSVYSPGYGLQQVVRRYIPGPAFVRQYIPLKPAHGCANLQITEARARPDADEAVNRLYQGLNTYAVSMRQHSGEASFTCEEGGRIMAGYYFAGTLSTRTQSQTGIWMVQHLFGFVAAREKATLAHEVVRHIVASVAVNPAWAQRQSQTTAETSRIVSQTNQAVSKIIDDTYWNRQRSQDEISRRRSNVILDLEDAIDPATGRQMKVESGSNYYWIDNRGTVVGTQTESLPSLDFRALTTLP
jgi:hypothetical protein